MYNSTAPTVIVGGGFVGLFTALHLSHQSYSEPIILIDPQERFAFKPLLYEYLTGEMQDEQVFPRYEELLSGSKVVFIRDRVTNIDLEQHRLELASGMSYDYRYLVLGVGSNQGYFGTAGATDNAFAFRTEQDVTVLARHLQECLQQASQTEDEQLRHSLLTFAITGAGPAGVEMAATLADLLPNWYAKLGGSISDIRIVLVNHGLKILAGDVNAHLRATTLEAFQDRAVPIELLLGVKVTAVAPDRLEYQAKTNPESTTLATRTTIWTAGTATNPLIESLTQIADTSKNKHGLPLVTDTLQLLDFPEVFAAGDCAVVKEHAYPAVAQIAYQQGKGIAQNLVALTQDRAPQPVPANMRGTLMKLGLGQGVANLFDKVQVKGKPGDLIRNATYLEMLPTPVHNFKATTEWLTDEIFHRYASPKSPLKPTETTQKATIRGDLENTSSTKANSKIWLGGVISVMILIVGSIVGWQFVQPWLEQQPTQEQNSVR